MINYDIWSNSNLSEPFIPFIIIYDINLFRLNELKGPYDNDNSRPDAGRRVC